MNTETQNKQEHSNEQAFCDLADSIKTATIEELTRQRDTLFAQLQECQAFINQFPRRIASARLDATSGRQTSYDYDTHGKCIETRVTSPNTEIVRVLKSATDLRS